MSYCIETNKACLELLCTNLSKENKALELNAWREKTILNSSIATSKRLAILEIIEHYLSILFTTKGL